MLDQPAYHKSNKNILCISLVVSKLQQMTTNIRI